MGSFSQSAWNQLKNITYDELEKAITKDGWIHDVSHGAVQVFRKSTGKRITLHYHPKKTYQPGLLKALLKDIGWTENDMRRLKLIK